MARMQQRGLFHKVALSLFKPIIVNVKQNQETLMVQLTAPDIKPDQECTLTYSQLFNAMTAYVISIKGINDIIHSIQNVLISSNTPEIQYSS